MNTDDLTLLKTIAQALDAKKAENIIVLDLQQQSSYLSYFIIATALSKTHLKTLFDEVQKIAQEHRVKSTRPQIPQYESGWVTFDLGFSVIHLFEEEKRAFYRLEDVWKNAKPVVFAQESSTDLTSRKGSSGSAESPKKKTVKKTVKKSTKTAGTKKKKTIKKTTKEKNMATAKKKPAKKAAKKTAKKAAKKTAKKK